MFPVARLTADPNDTNPKAPGQPDPRRNLALTWMTQVGSTVTAEFSLPPRNVLNNIDKPPEPMTPGNKALYPYLGKTWSVDFAVCPSATAPTADGQAAEMAATIGRLGASNVSVGFYAVSSAATGRIGGLLPADSGYAAAALAAARSAGLMFEGSRLPPAGTLRRISVAGWNPATSYGIIIFVNGDPATAVTTYQKPSWVPPAGDASFQPRFRAFALAGGRLAIGVEASAKVTSRDFADLVITLPSNARLRS
jgi:hypothetical protein